VDPLTAILSRYQPRDPVETHDLERLRALVRSDDDAWSRKLPLHVTGSALVVDPASGRVLLRWHERMQRWLQVGGHGDPGEDDPLEVALREGREETGLPDLVPIAADPVQVVIVPVPAHGAEPAHEHADIRYVLSTSRPDDAVAETATAALRWLSLDKAETAVVEDNLHEFFRRVSPLLAGWSG
jgi:8-oxo-dGTP pyrophosphatase MutT (NUDIX family)